MEDRLQEALTELIEAYDFIMDISELSSEEMVERVEEQAPSFIEHIESMEEPPRTLSDFWAGFGIWTVTRLRDKYSDIWHELIHTYFRSEAWGKRIKEAQFQTLIRSQIEQILEASDFGS